MQVLRGVLRSPRVNDLEPGREFWDGPKLLNELRRSEYFGGGDGANDSPPAYPPALQVSAAFCLVCICPSQALRRGASLPPVSMPSSLLRNMAKPYHLTHSRRIS